MAETYFIEVRHKPNVLDPLANQVLRSVREAQLKPCSEVTTAQLYKLIGSLTPKEHQRVADQLLTDPVIQEAELSELGAKSKLKHITVDVWFKPGVTDVVAESVLKGIRDLDISTISDVRTGMRYTFWGFKEAKAADKFATAHLLNPLIQDRKVHVA